MKKKTLLLILLFFFMTMVLLTFLGDKGILHLLRLQKELGRIREVNQSIEEENKKLREEVKRLQHEKRYIEEIARKELGILKEGEILYQFDSPKKGQEGSR